MEALEIGKFMMTAAACAGIWLKINKTMRQMSGQGEITEIKPNPLNIEAKKRAATMEDVENVVTRVNTLEKRMERHLKDMEKNQDGIETKLDEMRDRFDDKIYDLKGAMDDKHGEILRAVGRLEGK